MQQPELENDRKIQFRFDWRGAMSSALEHITRPEPSRDSNQFGVKRPNFLSDYCFNSTPENISLNYFNPNPARSALDDILPH
jgi:hypothetical protein